MRLNVEIKESDFNTTAKWTPTSYPSNGWYKNTDETGFVDLMVVSNGMISVLSWGEVSPFITDANEPEASEKEGVVSETFALKAIAIVKGVDVKEIEL